MNFQLTEPKLSLSWNVVNYQQESGFESGSVNGRKPRENDEWSLFTMGHSSKRSSTKESVSSLAKYLQEKSLTSVSSIDSKKSSFISETGIDTESETESWNKKLKKIVKN